jgi:hypothetical protein
LVVVPDATDAPGADRLHEERFGFTTGLMELHHRHRARPDLDFPGEVITRLEAVQAVSGAAFVITGSRMDVVDQRWGHRFGLSMIATGLPVIGNDTAEPLGRGAERQLALWAAWQLVGRTPVRSIGELAWLDEWKVPPEAVFGSDLTAFEQHRWFSQLRSAGRQQLATELGAGHTSDRSSQFVERHDDYVARAWAAHRSRPPVPSAEPATPSTSTASTRPSDPST